MTARLRPTTYAKYRPSACTGDILLCRAGSIEGRFISGVTHSQYTHAASIGWSAPDALMMAETRQHNDARLISLSGEIQKWSGYYDVYRDRRAVPQMYDPDAVGMRASLFDPESAWSFLCHAAGSRYSYNHSLRTWARHRLGTWIPPIPNSDDPVWPRDCSALVHAALRAGNGPQLKRYDCDVVPGDLADPKRFSYYVTLYWSEEEAARAQEIQDARRALAYAELDSLENGGADNDAA